MVGAAIECMPANSFARMRPARATITAAQSTGVYAGQTISNIFALGISLLCMTPILMPYTTFPAIHHIPTAHHSSAQQPGIDYTHSVHHRGAPRHTPTSQEDHTPPPPPPLHDSPIPQARSCQERRTTHRRVQGTWTPATIAQGTYHLTIPTPSWTRGNASTPTCDSQLSTPQPASTPDPTPHTQNQTENQNKNQTNPRLARGTWGYQSRGRRKPAIAARHHNKTLRSFSPMHPTGGRSTERRIHHGDPERADSHGELQGDQDHAHQRAAQEARGGHSRLYRPRDQARLHVLHHGRTVHRILLAQGRILHLHHQGTDRPGDQAIHGGRAHPQDRGRGAL